MQILHVKNVSKSYKGRMVVVNVSFQLAQGELLALIGPNGAGKTTCFNILDGHVKPDAGKVLLDGSPIRKHSPDELAMRGIARTFQDATIFRSMTVLENVQVSIIADGREQLFIWPIAQAHNLRRAEQLLELVGLQDYRYEMASSLSYSDLKRLELAMVIGQRPKVLLMDEPTAGMSPDERHAMMGVVQDICRQEDVSILYTEHDMQAVFDYANRILVMDKGRLIANGGPELIRKSRAVQNAYLGEWHK